MINSDQRQVILGSLLGKGHICQGNKNKFFQIKHHEKHFPWLQSKAEVIASLANPSYPKIIGNHCLWRSKCYSFLEEYHQLCYQGHKKIINLNFLDEFKALGLAVWCGDSAYLAGRNKNNICLRTEKFNQESVASMEQYFNEVGIPCNKNKMRKGHNIVFTTKGSKILLKIILPYTPKNRYFKLLGTSPFGPC